MINNNVISFIVDYEYLQKSMIIRNKVFVHDNRTQKTCAFYYQGLILGVITEYDYSFKCLNEIVGSLTMKIVEVNTKINSLNEGEFKFFVGTMQELNAMYNGN